MNKLQKNFKKITIKALFSISKFLEITFIIAIKNLFNENHNFNTERYFYYITSIKNKNSITPKITKIIKVIET